MVKKRKRSSKKCSAGSKCGKKKILWVVLAAVAVVLVSVTLVTLLSSNKNPEITGLAFKDAGYGTQVAYYGMISNYPLNLGMNTLQTEVKISSSTVSSLSAGYLVTDVAAVITGYAGIAADIKVMLGGLVPDPVTAAITLADKFVNYFRDSASKCLDDVASRYSGGEAHFVIGTVAETEYSWSWGGNYVYARNTYYTMGGSKICSERNCVGFIYDSGETTTSCW